MATVADRILTELRWGPLDDDVLTKRLGLNQRQHVNQTARRLAAQGRIVRYTGPEGKLVNALPGASPAIQAQAKNEPAHRAARADGLLSEDDVKAAVRDYFEVAGFAMTVRWGRERGVDIEATHPDGRRWLIEAKGAVASDQQQGNYFLGALGELIQRMDDPDAVYALALPDNRRYRGLADRLPRLAKQRLGLAVLWVRRVDGGGLAVAVETPPV